MRRLAFDVDRFGRAADFDRQRADADARLPALTATPVRFSVLNDGIVTSMV